VKYLGGEAGSVYDLAGLGDLVTTATSENSHHHALGRKLARGEHSEIRGEGVHTLMMVEKYAIFPWQEFPLFVLLHDIVLAKHEPAAGIEAFLQHWRA
jgi:glycerol-3-phosphate dehydrogenase (NAD(P)+)